MSPEAMTLRSDKSTELAADTAPYVTVTVGAVVVIGLPLKRALKPAGGVLSALPARVGWDGEKSAILRWRNFGAVALQASTSVAWG